MYRPSIGLWLVLASTTGQVFQIALGRGTDIPVPGDYDGDGKTDAAVYRPSTGTWFIRVSSPTINRTTLVLAWGLSGDVPVPADYDGDGKTDLAVYRPANGTWYILNVDRDGPHASVGPRRRHPAVPADYDGDGHAGPGRLSPRERHVVHPAIVDGYTTSVEYSWGLNGDIPIPNVIVANGTAVVAVEPADLHTNKPVADGRLRRRRAGRHHRLSGPPAGTWLSLGSAGNYSTFNTYSWGLSTDIPVAGDYDGDGKADVAVYRPSTSCAGTGYILKSSTGFTQGLVHSWAPAATSRCPATTTATA